MLKKSLLALSLILPFAATAAIPYGQLYRDANVQKLTVQEDHDGTQYLYVTLDKTPETNQPAYTQPACHTGPANIVAYDLSDPSTNAAMTLLLAAKATKTKVNIDAYGVCPGLTGVATVRNTELAE